MFYILNIRVPVYYIYNAICVTYSVFKKLGASMHSLITSMLPVTHLTGHAKITPQFPVPPEATQKKHVETIAFPTLPEDYPSLLVLSTF